jgi:NADP-dependent 3-hydroxy acid dehydrogenase YdfG
MRKSIFITGAAHGIGRATALLFAQKTWFVGLYDIDEVGVRDLARTIGEDRTHAARLDVTDADAFAQTVRAFSTAAGGRMDALFNNAGVLHMGFFEDVTPAECKHQVDVNVLGVIYGVHAALPLLERTKNSIIVNMSSASAIYGTPELAVYSATKFAVRALTEALDLELRRKDVRVADVMPGYVATDLLHHQKRRAKSMETVGIKFEAEDVANLVWQAVNGHELHVVPSKSQRIFLKLAGFAGVARPLMRHFAKL